MSTEADLGNDCGPVAHALLDFVGHLVPLRLPPVADLLYALLRPDLLLLKIAMQCVRSEITSASSLPYSLTFFFWLMPFAWQLALRFQLM